MEERDSHDEGVEKSRANRVLGYLEDDIPSTRFYLGNPGAITGADARGVALRVGR